MLAVATFVFELATLNAPPDLFVVTVNVVVPGYVIEPLVALNTTEPAALIISKFTVLVPA